MKLLIIKPSSLGDIVHGLQIANEIKCRIADVEIDWVVRDCFADVVRLSGIVDNIFLFHRHGGFWKFVNLIRRIRRKKYDFVLDLQGLARSGILTFFAHSENKVGRSDSREGAMVFYNKIVDLPARKNCHAIDILLEFLKIFNLEPRLLCNIDFKIDVKKIDSNILSLAKCSPICLFPGSRRKEKEWPYFGDLAKKLSDEMPTEKILIVGNKKISLPQRENIVDLTNKTTIAEMIFLIKNATLSISNDSAPVHISVAAGRPVLALFGPTDPRKYGPYNSSAIGSSYVLAKSGDLNNLSVDEVFSKIVDMI